MRGLFKQTLKTKLEEVLRNHIGISNMFTTEGVLRTAMTNFLRNFKISEDAKHIFNVLPPEVIDELLPTMVDKASGMLTNNLHKAIEAMESTIDEMHKFLIATKDRKLYDLLEPIPFAHRVMVEGATFHENLVAFTSFLVYFIAIIFLLLFTINLVVRSTGNHLIVEREKRIRYLDASLQKLYMRYDNPEYREAYEKAKMVPLSSGITTNWRSKIYSLAKSVANAATGTTKPDNTETPNERQPPPPEQQEAMLNNMRNNPYRRRQE